MIDIARFRFPLAQPFRFAGRTLTEREGFFLRIGGGGSGSGVGEVAPLPGASSMDAEGCLALLQEMDLDLVAPGARRREQDAALDGLPPALAFGISCARRLAEGDPVLTRPLRTRCGVNALLPHGEDAVRRALAEGRLDGFRTVKVKIGSADGAAERRILDDLLAALPASTRLRLDANRSLSLDEAIDRLRGLDPARIEYVEEPLIEPLEMPAFHFATGLDLALDESLLEPFTRSALETAPGVVAHVLKPSLHGRIRKVRERAERTARQGLRTTLSSALETSYTLRILARLASWLPGADGDHGLATGALLVGDPVAPLSLRDGAVDTGEPLTSPAIPFQPLESLHAR